MCPGHSKQRPLLTDLCAKAQAESVPKMFWEQSSRTEWLLSLQAQCNKSNFLNRFAALITKFNKPWIFKFIYLLQYCLSEPKTLCRRSGLALKNTSVLKLLFLSMLTCETNCVTSAFGNWLTNCVQALSLASLYFFFASGVCISLYIFTRCLYF